MGFSLFTQFDAMDCGPTCLKMIASFYGRQYPLDTLREYCFFAKGGVSLLGNRCDIQ